MTARVLVMGTGGVGGYFGAAMQAAGHDVVFVARGPNLEALRADGLTVTGTRDIRLARVSATGDPGSARERDLALLCVKSYDLEEATAAVGPCGGILLTLQNGVDAAERVQRVLGPVVLAGTTGIVADLVAPGRVEVVSTYSRIRFGEPDGGGITERVRRVASWLSAGGGIEALPEDDVRIALWEKMALICATAGLTTLYRSPVGPVLDSPEGRGSFRRVVAECAAVARTIGVVLPDGFEEARERYAESIDPVATTSMLRDLLRGKRLELEHLNGWIVRTARALGVDTPVNDAVYAGIKLAITASQR